MSEYSSRLAYSTDSLGRSWRAYDLDVVGTIDSEKIDTMDAARDLAKDLGESYETALAALLDSSAIPEAPSDLVKDFLRSRDMDKPRITIYTHDSFERMVADRLASYSSTAHARHDEWMDWQDRNDFEDVPPLEAEPIPYRNVEESSEDGIIVNFQLPKPLDIFWAKEQGAQPISWGALYRALADIPWIVVRAWEERHEDTFLVRRLNPIGTHENGDSGFYYLFEISPQ